MVSRSVGLAAALVCALLGATAASGGHREESIMNLMEVLRDDQLAKDEDRLKALHARFGEASSDGERRLINLGLGARYLGRNPRLAMQYLSAAEVNSREGDPLLPYTRYYAAQAKLASGAYREAADTALSLMALDLGDAWSKRLYTVLIEALSGLRDYPKLLETFSAFTKRFSFSRRQELLARLAAEAFARQGDREQEVLVLEELARGYPTTTESRWAFRRLSGYACDEANRGTYFFSQKLLNSLSRNAILDVGLREFVAAAIGQPVRFDDGTLRLLSLEEKADFLFKAKLFAESYTVVQSLYEAERARPVSPSLPNLIFEMGRIKLRMFEPAVAVRHFSKFLFDYPAHPLAARAYENMGDALRYLGLPLAAAENYAMSVAKSDSPLLRWHHFWNLYRGADFKGALALLDTPGYVAPREGDDRVVIDYWRGKTLAKLGRAADAAAIFKDILAHHADTFYANMLAVSHPELLHPGTSDPSPRGDTAGVLALSAKALATGSGDNAPPSSPSLRLISDLMQVGLDDAAAAQLARLRGGEHYQSGELAAVNRLSASLNDYKPSRRIRYSGFSALRTVPTAWSELLRHQRQHAADWKIYFPLAFQKVLAQVSSRIHLSPFIILSVMRSESFYNPEARSGVGAQGLMQLMPYTALKIATLLGDDQFDVLDLGRPEVNIGYGSYYLDRLLRYYGGNPLLAVAAYNGGPVVVNQWLESCKNCTADEFVEAVAYRETRRYVRDVMRSYAQYARIYTGETIFADIPPLPKQLPDGEEIF